MSHHRVLAASALAVFALLPAGCLGGNDESSSSPSSSPPSSSVTTTTTTASAFVSPVPKEAVAQVGEQEIAMGDYQRFLAQTKARYEDEGRELPQPGTAAWTTLKTGLVQFLVERVQLEQKASELGIEVTDEQVAERLAALKQTQFGGSDAKLQAELAKRHVTLASLEADIRAQLVRERLYAKITRGVRVTDEEVRDYYHAHMDAYRTPASRLVRQIRVRDQARAEAVYKQLQDGADFAQLAKRYSTDRSSAASGGTLTLYRNGSAPAFEAAVFALDENELSTPVRTPQGWYVAQALSEVSPAELAAFATVEKQIHDQLLDAKKSEKMTEWVEVVSRKLSRETNYQTGFLPLGERARAGTGAP